MAYTTRNTPLYRRALLCRWVKYEAVAALALRLTECDYSVIDSRRDAHTALNEFMSSMVLGKTIFHRTLEFPDTEEDIYCTTMDEVFFKRLNSLATVLSHRNTNVAKDVAAPRNGQRDSTSEATTEQGEQDNVKRFEVLKQQLLSSKIYDRALVHAELSLTWA